MIYIPASSQKCLCVRDLTGGLSAIRLVKLQWEQHVSDATHPDLDLDPSHNSVPCYHGGDPSLAAFTHAMKCGRFSVILFPGGAVREKRKCPQMFFQTFFLKNLFSATFFSSWRIQRISDISYKSVQYTAMLSKNKRCAPLLLCIRRVL